MQSVKPKPCIPGETFGRWTVIGESAVNEGSKQKWLCRCECGTERYVLERSLLYGGSTSCGCLRKERASQAISPDLTRKQFGELTVIRRVENRDKRKAVRYLCQCSCGNAYEVSGTLLVTGRRTHCANRIHQKAPRYSDITDQKFGRLTALYPAEQQIKNGSMVWHCRCDCGNQIDVSYNSLMYGNQKSCGCQKKEHDQKLHSFLTHVAGTSVDMLKSKKLPSDNTSGYKGVYLLRGKYMARIVFQKKPYYLGTYDTIEEAAAARRGAEEMVFDTVAEHYRLWKLKAEQDPVWAEENPVQVLVTQEADKKLHVVCLPELSL